MGFSFSAVGLMAGLFVVLAAAGVSAQGLAEPVPPAKPVRTVIIGATHAHVGWILGRPADAGDIELVGIYEPNEPYAQRLIKQYKLDPAIYYTDLDAMLEAVQPEAACLFGSIYDHKEHTLVCAERGIHVMVEKPLAVSVEHARAMADAATRHGIHVLTNYETTWYASNRAAYDLAVGEESLGPIRRIVVHDGHQGPREIGCGEEFLAWLTDPKLNGGGAVTDFGCYGANLATWLMRGERPTAVSATLRQFKPEVYPNVDDDATIVLEYTGAVAVIQASWNWPASRKDMQVYGSHGQVHTIGRDGITVGLNHRLPGEEQKLKPLQTPEHDPFAHLAAVVRGRIEPNALSSLANNLIVVEILDAAKRSAAEGRKVELAGD